MSRILSIDYGDARVGIAITDALNITAQGLETIQRNNSDKIILRRLDEIFEQYEVKTIVIGMPYNMNGTKTERAEVTEKFIHKLKCSTQNDELLRNKSKKEKINSRHNISSIHFRNIYKSTKLNKTVAKKQKIGYYMNDISIEILNL